MYQLSYNDTTHTFNTFGDVLVYMNRRNTADNSSSFNPSGNVTIEKNCEPLVFVRNSYGKYGIQQEGSAFDLFMDMLHEVEYHYVKKNGEVLQPYQMLRDEWDAVVAIGSATYNVYPCFTNEQLGERKKLDGVSGALYPSSISNFCEHMFVQHFGYGHNGPLFGKSKQSNSRHELHVAFALAAGIEVPDEVIAEYSANKDIQGKHDISNWFMALLHIPQLRGKMPVEKLSVLCGTLQHNQLHITVENAPAFISLMGELPDEVSYNGMDDFLFSKGILPPLPMDKPLAIVDIPADAKPFSLRLRQMLGEWRGKSETERIEEQRKSGNISERYFLAAKHKISQFMHAESMDWPNRMADALENLNIDALLYALDTPNDSNTLSKKAIQEYYGLKLLGLKAKDRRDAIFTFCGYDSEKRKQYEQSVRDKAEQKAMQRASKEAEERASQSQWRMDNGSIVSGKEYVDTSVEEGYTVIASTRKGRALQYWLKNVSKGAYRNILSKDGTLDYARLTLCLEEERKAA